MNEIFILKKNHIQSSTENALGTTRKARKTRYSEILNQGHDVNLRKKNTTTTVDGKITNLN